MHKNIIVISSLFFLFACKEKENNMSKTLPQINFNEVDAYPLLPNCKEVSNRELQKTCFYRELSKIIQINIAKHTIKNNVQSDTIYAKIYIDNKGKSYYKNLSIRNDLLDSILEVSINKTPLMEPAIKKGIPVNIEVTLPIIVN